MLSVPKTDPIEYLLKREFPAYVAVMLPPPITAISRYRRPVSTEKREWQESMRARIEARRKVLEALPLAERTKLVEAERAKEVEEWRVKAELQERAQPFNQPHAHADFDHWGKMAYWSLDESIALCYGRDPRAVTWKSIAPLVQVSPFAKQFADAREIANRAAGVNEIAQSNIPGPFIAWAKRVGLPFPMELEAKVAERGPIADWRTVYEQEHAAHATTAQQARARIAELERELAAARGAGSPDKSLDTRERTTLLCIIGALAGNASVDLSQPMKAGETIAAMMPNVKLSGRTIGEHLKAVREAMDSRKD